jgi:predicted nicotinamide N-methyase
LSQIHRAATIDAPGPVFPTPPPDPELEQFLDRYAPLSDVSLCPEIRAFTASSLVDVWEAAEQLAATVLPSPFWAFPWPAGIALARVILDRPELVRARKVIDMGAGGGVTCFACASAGARQVLACDVDPWSLAVARIGARRQALAIDVSRADPASYPEVLDPFDVVLCADLAYDRATAALERMALERAAARGATVLLANAGRSYFDVGGLELIADFTVPAVQDLEGDSAKFTQVFRLGRRAH